MTLRRFLMLAALLGLAWWLLRPAPPTAWNGRAAPHAPVQSADGLPAPWRNGEYTFKPLARFECEAVVLSRRNYRSGRTAELCRTDFALGWGAMSDAAVINCMRVSQDMRWFFFEWRGELPVPAGEVMHAAANMHLIPASNVIRRELAGVQRHELLRFHGYLVEVSAADGWSWKSSLSRSDSGGGACEVVWVEDIESAAVAELRE